MTSLYRPLLSSLLCCVIALGNLPAVLHVVSCHGHGHDSVQSEVSPVSTSLGHSCHHHSTAKGHAFDESSESHGHDGDRHSHGSPSAPVHDSDHCKICHSLANLVGVIWNVELSLLPECFSESVSVCADHFSVNASAAIPQPRGPPAIA